MSDYFLAMVGGLLISLASSINLLLKGRITGISGICWSVISLDHDSINWKVPFLLSFIFIGAFARFFMSFENQTQFFLAPKELISGVSSLGFLVGGLCVGLGTKLANGCTSGHGVCGLPRFSLRSWIAVPTFLGTALIVANLRANFPFFQDNRQQTDIFLVPSIFASSNSYWLVMLLSGLGLALFTLQKIYKKNHKAYDNIIIGSLVGAIFAFGLIVSGMVDRSKVLNFLTLGKNWDPSLMLVLMAAVLLNMLFFNHILAMESPLHGKSWEFNRVAKLDRKLIAGSAVFGVGWGITGLCPGPAVLNFQFGTVKVSFFYLTGLVAGMYLGHYLDKGLLNLMVNFVNKHYQKHEHLKTHPHGHGHSLHEKNQAPIHETKLQQGDKKTIKTEQK